MPGPYPAPVAVRSHRHISAPRWLPTPAHRFDPQSGQPPIFRYTFPSFNILHRHLFQFLSCPRQSESTTLCLPARLHSTTSQQISRSVLILFTVYCYYRLLQVPTTYCFMRTPCFADLSLVVVHVSVTRLQVFQVSLLIGML